MRRIDLHTHSHYSDGTTSPAEVVKGAFKRRVELLVLSDHDTVDGWAEAKAEADRQGLAFAAGIEINTRESDAVHVLGYGIDPKSPALKARLEEFRGRRRLRIGRIIERLKEAGLDISLEDVSGVSKQTLGRPHVADALRRKKIVQTRQEAFQKYLIRGKPGYVDPMGPSIEESIQTIREAGGFASLAHPGLLKNGNLKLEEWKALGLEGLEIYYPTHSMSYIQELLERARSFGLMPTGGSDYHGPGSGREEIGGIEVPDEVYDRLVERLG